MKAIFFATVIACALCGSAFALGTNGRSLNGTSLNLAGLNGTSLNLAGSNGTSLNLAGNHGSSNSGAVVDLNSLHLVRAAIRH